MSHAAPHPDESNPLDYHEVSRMVDHSMLHPSMTAEDFEHGIELAIRYECASVCIMPWYVGRTSERLAGTGVVSSTVIGFPLGGNHTAGKVAESRSAIGDGATELDMVCNVSAVLSGRWDVVRSDIAAVIEVAHGEGAKVKVIFENCYLEDRHKERLCEICTDLSADWVKTSTGFGTGGATIEDLTLMRRLAGDEVQVKAAGGVRDFETLLQVRRIGVSRCGTSSTPKLLDPARLRWGLPPIEMGDLKSTGY